jgi:hypothetical protein
LPSRKEERCRLASVPQLMQFYKPSLPMSLNTDVRVKVVIHVVFSARQGTKLCHALKCCGELRGGAYDLEKEARSAVFVGPCEWQAILHIKEKVQRTMPRPVDGSMHHPSRSGT